MSNSKNIIVSTKSQNKLSPKSYLQRYIYINPDILVIGKKRKKKKPDNQFLIPNFEQSNHLIENDYSNSQLRKICKNYELKISGNKCELRYRIFNYLLFSNKAVYLQKIWRRYVVRSLFNMKGILNKKKCTNQTEFLTLDSLDNLSFWDFYSYKDLKDNNYWGFDIKSLYTFILNKRNEYRITNPYNRQNLPEETERNLIKIIKMQKIIGFPISLLIENNLPTNELKRLEMRTRELFHQIDLFGYCCDPNWFLDLSRRQIIRLARELYDIWHYRLGLTNEIRQAIAPRFDPYRNFRQHHVMNPNLNIVRNAFLDVIKAFISEGRTQDDKALGALYVLTALTIVSERAALALPWLYQIPSH
tara:strand:- start:2797 stop:3876 length:1080 start_codon:yes stop_codon:yes gene_type:complete